VREVPAVLERPCCKGHRHPTSQSLASCTSQPTDPLCGGHTAWGFQLIGFAPANLAATATTPAATIPLMLDEPCGMPDPRRPI